MPRRSHKAEAAAAIREDAPFPRPADAVEEVRRHVSEARAQIEKSYRLLDEARAVLRSSSR